MKKLVVKKTIKKQRPGRHVLTGPGPGRPKGSKNKFTTLKRAFLNVFEKMGGEETLLEFAETHKLVFYQMLTKLFPQEVEHSGEIKTTDPLIVKVVFVKDVDSDKGNGNGNGGNGNKAKA